MKTIKQNCTDAELSAAVAEAHDIAITPEREHVCYDSRSVTVVEAHYPPFATCVDAVLPLLGDDWDCRVRNKDYIVVTIYRPSEQIEGYAQTVPRAACFALLKAKGWTVEETK